MKNAAPDNLLPAGGGNFLNQVDGNLTATSSPSGVILKLPPLVSLMSLCLTSALMQRQAQQRASKVTDLRPRDPGSLYAREMAASQGTGSWREIGGLTTLIPGDAWSDRRR